MNQETRNPRTGLGLCLSLLIAFVFAWTPIRDTDTWYHLATGRLIAQTHAIPTVDTWTLTAAGNRWNFQQIVIC